MGDKPNIWELKVLLDLNQLIIVSINPWKIYLTKIVQYAIDHLIGERNGLIAGMKLFIVLRDAEEEDQKDERNIYYFS